MASLALSAPPKLLVKVKTFKPPQTALARQESSANFGKLSRIDKKKEKLTDAQLDKLKEFGPMSASIIQSKSVDDILGLMKDIKGSIGLIRTRAFAIRVALSNRRTSKKLVERCTSLGQAQLQTDMFEHALDGLKKFGGKYDIEEIKTYCLMELKTFAMNLRMCMVYKSLTEKIGMDKLPESAGILKLQDSDLDLLEVAESDTILPD
jgi:hypothetical protein